MGAVFELMNLALGFQLAMLVMRTVLLAIPILLLLSTAKIVISFFKKNETEEILRSRQQLMRKLTECNYLRGLLDQHGIDWETGWRQL